jgi:Fusaric acid resistance protein-like
MGTSEPQDGGRVSFRERWPWVLQMNTTMTSPFIGFVCAVSIGVPLAVGIATGYPRVGGWAGVGAFFTDMAVFQPGHRFRARIVAGTGVLVAVGAFLGALCGIRGIAIYPVVVLCTFGAGLLVELGPQAALIGVSAVTSLVFSASFDVSPAEAFVVGGVTLLGGLFTAVLAVVTRRGLARYADPTVRSGPTGWTWARQAAMTLRRSSHLRSVSFWHAVRLTAAALAGTVLFRVTNPDDGFWIPEAALFIMRPEPQLTRRRAVLRIIGSVAGATLTTLLLLALRPGTTLLALLAVVASGVAFSVQRVNFGLYITFVTCIFVLLTAFGGLPARTALSNRVVDNLIGSALAVAALWLWPSRPRHPVPPD